MHCMHWPVNRTAGTWHARTLLSVCNHLHDRDFWRSYRSLSCSTNSPLFVERGCSSPCSHQPTKRPYRDSDESSSLWDPTSLRKSASTLHCTTSVLCTAYRAPSVYRHAQRCRCMALYTPVITIHTFSNSAFCPHIVYMCFVWMWEQTAIIPLYNINWLVHTIGVNVRCYSRSVRRSLPAVLQCAAAAAASWFNVSHCMPLNRGRVWNGSGCSVFQAQFPHCLKQLRKPTETAKKTASPVWRWLL